MVRLQLDGLKVPNAKNKNKFGRAKVVKNTDKKRKLDPDDPDFDSEVEYGSEN